MRDDAKIDALLAERRELIAKLAQVNEDLLQVDLECVDVERQLHVAGYMFDDARA